MKLLVAIGLVLTLATFSTANAEVFDAKKFAKDYFDAWTATQSPTATNDNLEHYLSFLKDDVGHQHLPYDPDGSRSPDGKENMLEGMSYYLGGHTEYSGKLISYTDGHNVIVLKYETSAKGIHPQTKEVITLNFVTVEVLEIENGKVSVIRKYSE